MEVLEASDDGEFDRIVSTWKHEMEEEMSAVTKILSRGLNSSLHAEPLNSTPTNYEWPSIYSPTLTEERPRRHKK